MLFSLRSAMRGALAGAEISRQEAAASQASSIEMSATSDPGRCTATGRS